jgi:hypothetical protein
MGTPGPGLPECRTEYECIEAELRYEAIRSTGTLLFVWFGKEKMM